MQCRVTKRQEEGEIKEAKHVRRERENEAGGDLEAQRRRFPRMGVQTTSE